MLLVKSKITSESSSGPQEHLQLCLLGASGGVSVISQFPVSASLENDRENLFGIISLSQSVSCPGEVDSKLIFWGYKQRLPVISVAKFFL